MTQAAVDGRQAGARHLRRPAAAQRRAGRHADPAHSRTPCRRRWRMSSRTRAPSPATRSRSSPARCCTASPAPSGCRSTAPTTRRPTATGPGVVVSARAPDGVIEAIEAPRAALLPGRAVAPRIRHQPRRPGDHRGLRRRLPGASDEPRPPRASASPRSWRVPACARGAKPRHGSPPAASASTARC